MWILDLMNLIEKKGVASQAIYKSFIVKYSESHIQ